jgi:hypothetical protein
MRAYVCDRYAWMHIYLFNICTLMDTFENNMHAYVCACGGDNRTHEAKMGGVKICLF